MRARLLIFAAVALPLAAVGCTASDPVATAPSSTASSAPSTSGASTGSGPVAGSNGTEAPGTSRGGSTTSAASGSATTTSAASSPSNSTTTRPDGAPPPTISVSPEDEQFCTKVIDAQSTLGQIDPTTDPAAALNAYRQVIDHLAQTAPAGVKADIELINAAVQKATTYQDLVSMGTPELRAASDRIDAWTNEHCGTTLNG
jgi:hypothetical protein